MIVEKINAARAKVAALAATAAVAVMAAPAAMAAIDVTQTTTDIGASKEPIGLIGIAVLGVVVALVTFGWVRKAIRG